MGSGNFTDPSQPGTLGCRLSEGRKKPIEMIYSACAMQGLHLTADLFDCRCELEQLTQAEPLGVEHHALMRGEISVRSGVQGTTSSRT